MKTFGKTTLIALAATAAALTAAAAPMAADAAPFQRGGWHQDRNHRDDRAEFRLNERVQTLQTRIYAGSRNGQLSRFEAQRLERELTQISWQSRAAERSGRGLSPAETAALSARLDRLSMQVNVQRHDGNRW